MKHAAIFETVRREILAGRYGEGRTLPSERVLADRFGCSRPTISRVMLDLRREGLVVTRPGAATRVSRFALNATGALGLVVPGDCYTETFPSICSVIERLASARGWDVVRGEITASDPKVRAREAKSLAARFSSEHVAGVFVQPLEFLKDPAKSSAEIITCFDAAAIPVCLLDYDIVSAPSRSGYDLVGFDNVNAGLAVGRALLDAGLGKIAFLKRPGAAPTVTDRLRGVACAVLEAGGVWTQDGNVLVCEPGDSRAVSRFVSAERPDAIVSGNDIAAVELGATLRRIGGSARSIRLAGFDDVALAAKHGLTTVRQPCAEIATVALETLLSRIRHPSLPVRTTLLAGRLVVR